MTGFSLAPLVRQALESHGDRVALVDEAGDGCTYRDLRAEVSRRAEALRAVPATRLAVVLPMQLDAAVWWLTALAADVSIAVLSGAAGDDEHEFHVAALGPDALVTADGGLQRTAPTEGPARAPAPMRQLMVSTSGTTGTPKAVIHNDETLGRAIWVTTMLRREVLGRTADLEPGALTAAILAAAVFEDGPQDLVFLNGMPLSTISGVTVLLQSILTGATSVITERFTPDGFLDLIEAVGVTNLALSPYMAQSLVRRQGRAPRITRTVLATGIGGGPASATLCHDVESTIGGLVAVGYGLTETAGPALMARYGDDQSARWETIGRPAPGVRARVRGPGDEPGDLEIAHPGLCHGYLDRTGQLKPPPTRDGFLSTGDVATVRDDGNYVIEGRASDLIIRGGRNVDHLRIERLIEPCAGVTRVAVVGAPSAVEGEEDVCAVVELDRLVTDLATVRGFVRSALAPNDRPQRILQVGRLPTTPDLEVRRSTLRAMIRQGVVN